MSSSEREAPVEEEELYSSWALLIQTVLLILALWTSYYLQVKQIRMFVGLIIRLSPGYIIQAMVSFKYSYFFNLLLPPIILNSGYEMKKERFFKNLGAILTFALLDSLSLSLLDSMIFGSVLSATDPVTVLTIFQSLKVDPQLYAIIFGESILNDATAIVLYETLKQYRDQEFHFSNIGHGYSKLYKFPPIESCIVALMAYASYLFSNGCHLSGIVSLLFCGITLKHYAYDNMSLMTKRTTKYMFRVLAQLSENFIFIYLGLTLFTKPTLDFKPFFIFFTAIFICVSRYCAVFPLSNMLNAIARYRKRSEILPSKHSIMLFWSGLRGAVAFALAAGLKGPNANAMSTTILVVVVLSVIVFGGTTSRMLEILKVETGVDEGEIDSDDEAYNEYNDYNHVLTNSQGSIVSSDNNNSGDHRNISENINNLSSSQAHWFISFDDKYLKPLFTRQCNQDTKPEERWHHERNHNDEIIGLSIETQKHPN
ncbi:40946_t:CDS:2 [Gigaspora margarita]|uniref:40946_t:CDS:1 n=1 Tax=Gigaspora margarita TaxID=4874 RepID=A0ABN7UBZ0_GIGMA|nr:40946_t:CDS:2 [Gigaspora margarita]